MSVAFQENSNPVKPAVPVGVAEVPWQPPSFDELHAFYINKARLLKRARFTASDSNLLRAMTILSLEFKRRDHFRGVVRDCLKNIEDSFGG